MIHKKTSGGELARLSFTARDLVGWASKLNSQSATGNQVSRSSQKQTAGWSGAEFSKEDHLINLLVEQQR